eukprot:TRINITY_DN4103_c0_g1_i1.p1 TRINITY_DN4103_c0_g1~~TRINITY_DN4103_c0_g1_i1.p1  ORF type:complete len:143 (-),score=32.82 TRINITY_DN4103_c0_g1_i1:18-446(-)
MTCLFIFVLLTHLFQEEEFSMYGDIKDEIGLYIASEKTENGAIVPEAESPLSSHESSDDEDSSPSSPSPHVHPPPLPEDSPSKKRKSIDFSEWKKDYPGPKTAPPLDLVVRDPFPVKNQESCGTLTPPTHLLTPQFLNYLIK